MVVLGRLIAPFGVGGWLRLHPFGDDPAAWSAIPQWWLAKEAEGCEWTAYQPKVLKPHGDGWLIKFSGVDSRSASEALAGRYMAVPRESLPQTVANEYYWADLVGLTVVNIDGVVLGTVSQLIETGANTVLEVCLGQQRRLLPFVAQVVKEVELASGCIRVDWGSDW